MLPEVALSKNGPQQDGIVTCERSYAHFLGEG